MGVRDEGDGAVDAAWNEAVMKPLPSTPTSAEREPGQHVPTHQDSSDNFFNQGTAFENVETVSEDSEGWESEDDCGSVLSSIASFDLDKALGELELDQQVSSKADKPSSAKSKSPSIYYSPATTFESSPPDTSSPRIAQPNDVPGVSDSLECLETLASDGADIGMLPPRMQHPIVSQASPTDSAAQKSPDGLAGHQTLLERLSSQGNHMGHRASVQSAPVSPAASTSASSGAAESPVIGWTSGSHVPQEQGRYSVGRAGRARLPVSVRPRQLRLGGSSEDEGTSGSQLADLYGSASGVASWRPDTRRLVLSDSEAEEPAAADISKTPEMTPAVLRSAAQADQAAAGSRSASSSAESTPLQLMRSILRGSISRRPTRLSDGFEDDSAHGATQPVADGTDDSSGDSPPLTVTRTLACRRTVRFRLSSRFEGPDSDSGSDAGHVGGFGSAVQPAAPLAGGQASAQSPVQAGDDPYVFSSGDELVAAGRSGMRARRALSDDSSSAIVISDSDADSTAGGGSARNNESSDEAASGQENLCTPNHDAWPSHSFATPARRPLSEVDDNQNAQVTGFSATPRPPAGQRAPVGSQTLPVLRTGMPTGQQELPVTPKTAPRAFVPSTPTKSGRPAVTPMSVAAFRRRRSALARSMFQEFNASVFGNRLPGDLEISWNAHLRTTAGTTHYKREPPTTLTDPPRHTARVELSSKVLDSRERLRATLLHELCHVAAWVLPPHAAKPPHGPVFKRWAAAAAAAHPDVPVTTCHSYNIHVPFQWQCENPECAQVYKRHSKSIDAARQACGLCRGRLAFLGKFRPDGTPAKARAPSAFSAFVRDNFADMRSACPPGTPQQGVMSALSARWRQHKASAEGGPPGDDSSAAVRSLDSTLAGMRL